jgi:hypothetical protein
MEAQEQYILLSNCDFLNLVGMKYSMICEAKQESFIEWICSLVSTGLLKGVFLESGSPEVTFSFSSAVVSSEARLADSLISCFEKFW